MELQAEAEGEHQVARQLLAGALGAAAGTVNLVPSKANLTRAFASTSVRVRIRRKLRDLWAES